MIVVRVVSALGANGRHACKIFHQVGQSEQDRHGCFLPKRCGPRTPTAAIVDVQPMTLASRSHRVIFPSAVSTNPWWEPPVPVDAEGVVDDAGADRTKFTPGRRYEQQPNVALVARRNLLSAAEGSDMIKGRLQRLFGKFTFPMCGSKRKDLFMAGLQFSTRGDVLVALFTAQDIRDPAEVQQVSAELLATVERPSSRKLLLDFGNVKLISSEMVGQLFVLVNRCEARGVHVKACGLSDNIRLILETVRILNALEVHDNQAEASEAFGCQPSVGVDPLEFEIHPDFLRARAATGDGDAEFDLAMCYEQGRGVAQDMVASLQCLRRAAEHGHAEAQYRLGMVHAYGINVPLDYEAAVRWYHCAAEQGQADAQYALGMTCRYGLMGVQDEEAAVKWYAKAAAQGHERAILELKQSPLSNP